MESFYGGMRGNSFNIVKTYNSKSEMLIDFLSASCEVGYGEYAVINSSDNDNGSIYKRTDNISVNNGAVFIGNFAGSIGKSSTINFSPNFNSIAGDPIILSNTTGSMVPGYTKVDSQDIYNDNIAYKTLQVTTDNGINTTIAFQFPYPVLDFTSETVTGLLNAEIVRLDDGSHPYYYSYKLRLPQTLKQNRIKELKVITVTDEDEILDNPQDQNNITNEYINKTIIIYTLEEPQELITIDKQYFLCLYDFLKDIEYNSTTDKIIFRYNDKVQEVPLKQINSITLSDAGELSVSYSNSSETTIINPNTPIKWVKNITYNDTLETINFIYNTDEIVAIPFSMRALGENIITNIEVSNNGEKLLVYKNNSITPEEVTLHPLKQISDIIVDADGVITYTYTDGSTPKKSSDDNIFIRWIEDIRFDSENNQFIITYNTKKEGTEINESDIYTWELKTIVSAVRDGADLVINYNTGSPSRINDVFQINTINNFRLDSLTGQLKIDFGEDTVILGTISYVNNIVYNEDTQYLQYYYQNSPIAHDIVQLKMLNTIMLTDDNELLVYYNTSTTPISLGQLETNHILDIEMILDSTNVSDPLGYLRATYPNGYNDNPYYCVAAGKPNQRTLYAYGYYSQVTQDGTTTISDTKNWYAIGDFTKTLPIAISDSSLDEVVQNLPVGGIWFITENK